MLFQHPGRPSLMRASANFTRPADTTAYTAGDLVANSVTAASVTPMSWTLPRAVGGIARITGALFRKSDRTLTNARVRVYLFNATPTIATTGDNGVFADVVTGYTSCLGYIEADFIGQFAAGAIGRGQPLDDRQSLGTQIIAQPASGRLIYGLLSALMAYTPASAEVFTVELEFERA